MRRRCLRPALKRIPEGEWFCPSCASLAVRPVPWAEELLHKQAGRRVSTHARAVHRAVTVARWPHVARTPWPGKQVEIYWDGEDRWYAAEVRRRKRLPEAGAERWQPGGAQ